MNENAEYEGLWQVVAAHGGELRLESKMGEGSVFTVLLPAGE